MQKQGYVTYAGSNDWKGKKLYSLKMADQDGWFNCGTEDPKVKKGDRIKFDYEELNGKFNVKVASISTIGDGVASVSDSATRASGGTKGGNTGYWDERLSRDVENDVYRKANDLRIQYQSARNASISVVDTLLREKALKLPVKDPYEAIMGKIEDLTNYFYAKCSGIPSLKSPPEKAGATADAEFDDQIPFGDS